LPNYTPNAQWGTQGDPIRTMQKPLEPAESMKHLATFPEFEVSLFAAEPEVIKPIWLAWDERGRLWIAETVDYPNELKAEGEGRDRLKICEDTNGDGRADKFTVFVDQLSIPTGFVFANGGVIVIHSGKTEFFKDTNGDDKADERNVLFSGWGMGDTHATASNLRYGFDNWIWGTVGYSGFRGTVGGKQVRFGQGIFRFKPDGSELEFVRSSNNNTWGLGITEENIIFGSTANGNASMYMPIANRYYEAVSGWSASRLETIADSQRFYPLTEQVRQVDFHGRYTAGAGSAIYTAAISRRNTGTACSSSRNQPAICWASSTSKRAARILSRTMAATSPRATTNGLRPWWPKSGPTARCGSATGITTSFNTTQRRAASARVAARRMRRRCATKSMGGFIASFTIKPSLPQAPRLDKAAPGQLVAALKSDNMLWRMHAQRLLVSRANKDVVPALCELIGNASVDE
jgi:putative membrane-bound dehydrogenase-like protein